MDYTIIKLLFYPKGAITSREFRAGISVLLIAINCSFGLFLIKLLYANIIMDYWHNPAYYIHLRIYNYILAYTSFFTNINFIFAYPSIILAIKRARMLNLNLLGKIIASTSIYLFFASISSITSVFYTSDNFMYVILIFIIIGLINIAYFSIHQSKEKLIIHQKVKNKLNVIDYTLSIGKLIFISTLISIVLYTTAISINRTNIVLLLVPILVLFIFYVKYSFYRLNDAKISISWSIGIVGAIIIAHAHWIFLINNMLLAFIYGAIISLIILNLLCVGQFLLFLLPSKKHNDDKCCEVVNNNIKLQ